MVNKQIYYRDILALDDTQLEQFVLDWVNEKTKKTYSSAARFSGAGDLGRDVVGFLTADKHEGAWHNYQCKQYTKSLGTGLVISEIGKILYYAFLTNFTAPTAYYFVAPRGLNRNVEKLIFNPSQFKEKLISEWDNHCSKNIISGSQITLDSQLKAFIEAYNFSNIGRFNLDDILSDDAIAPVLFKWFKSDPGAAPKGVVPTQIVDNELPYINQLVDAYSEREGKVFSTHEELSTYSSHQRHLSIQRERFYDAAAFKRFYRDNTDNSVIESFEEDIYHGILDTHDSDHKDALTRLTKVMEQAAVIAPSGPLATYAKTQVKQGICHHFANEDKVKWRK
ncbi:ABC-three component system protein [Methylophilus sp. QUAN]|uniref:ABC-three component system protein n=1 Tax=Methylophilus sp. QUAN TaxID=2781020 RepID=UPI00188F2B88|nr:ABC-three component system protein [Methylophilus sp. QUAN]MBF4990224.1 hypothetical protein [Methylophilus sp. QUAN]